MPQSISTSLTPSIDEKPENMPPDLEQQSNERTKVEPSQQPSSPEPITPWHPSQFPDGGRDAYLCLIGAACCLFCSFGWLNALGVFQNYYQGHQLREYSPSDIAWIPSLQIFIMFLPGPLVGLANDNYGPRYILLFGMFFHVFGVMMTSLCKEYYQFLLAQGVCSPLGLNCIFQAAASSLPTWFLKKRGLAFGIMAAGSGLGGVIFPIMASHLIPQIGFAWTMRTLAFMILGLLTIALFTIKSRLPPKPRSFQLKVFLEPFNDGKFLLITIASFFTFLGLFVPINFIQVEAIHKGMGSNLASYLLPILNSASIFGRIIPGLLADKYGKFNMQALCCLAAGIVVLALGIPASGNAAYIVFAVLFGFFSGAYVSLFPAQMSQISKVEQIGVRVGVAFACVSFAGLVSEPIAGAIVDANKGAYWGMNLFAGLVLVAGGMIFVWARMILAGWKIMAWV